MEVERSSPPTPLAHTGGGGVRGYLDRVASLRALLGTSQKNVHKDTSQAHERITSRSTPDRPPAATQTTVAGGRGKEREKKWAKTTAANTSSQNGMEKGAKLKRTLSQRSQRSLGRKKYLAPGRSIVSTAPSRLVRVLSSSSFSSTPPPDKFLPLDFACKCDLFFVRHTGRGCRLPGGEHRGARASGVSMAA
jgi:hypothetical protein